MIHIFEDYLQHQTSLSKLEIERMIAAAIPRKLRRNEFLLSEGEICRHKIFICKGLLRSFGTNANGDEHILQFSAENQWTLDAESYDEVMPSRYNIATVEPSEILMWAKPDFERLLADIPSLTLFASKLISRNVYSTRQRLSTTLSATPEQKYDDFLKTSPQLLQRLPLRMVAAYLGISLKTLNRVRQSQLLAK
jgi:CRP/FNR family transcriptional regulator, anaerobic regulatory protein